MERAGATFPDKQREDTRPMRYAGAAAMALLMSAVMVGGHHPHGLGLHRGPDRGPAPAPGGGAGGLPVVVILGVVLALVQRIGEIRKGEEDDAKNY